MFTGTVSPSTCLCLHAEAWGDKPSINMLTQYVVIMKRKVASLNKAVTNLEATITKRVAAHEKKREAEERAAAAALKKAPTASATAEACVTLSCSPCEANTANGSLLLVQCIVLLSFTYGLYCIIIYVIR